MNPNGRLKIGDAKRMAAIAVHVILFVRKVWQECGNQEHDIEERISEGAGLMMRIDQTVSEMDVNRE